jgi:cyclophilin family peptidyl-prolyl cis-trans isomerase
MLSILAIILLASVVSAGAGQMFPQSQDDPVLKKLLDLGKNDNQIMNILDTVTNRFGGRFTGTNAYTNACNWAVWQFKQWGLQAELDEVGEVPVGFNRGPWFGKMIKPSEKTLNFGTPEYTAGTHGVQRGPVVVSPAKEEEVEAKKASIKGAWVLIPGASNGWSRDPRPNFEMTPLTKKLYEAGALGTIQSAREPITTLYGGAQSWEKLPVLPDVKLAEKQYNEIKDLVDKGQTVELEFDIRNWFYMGPVKYHNVVAWIPGTTYPDEYVIMGGHFDSFDGATGAVDDGSGSTTAMEALRLLAKAGARPKRSVMAILFAAEENGLVGSQAWLKNHANLEANIAVMFNKDHNPSAAGAVTVPSAWYPDFVKIVEPIKNFNPKFPFDLRQNEYPSAPPVRPGGTDSSSFSMRRIPTLTFTEVTDFNYSTAWHTLLDTFNQVVPYTEHQQQSAVVTAVVAYGVANLDRQLTRDGVYLPDGLYADITTGKGRIMTTLDYANAPLYTAEFIRMVEGGAPQPAGAQQGRGGGGGGGGRGGPGGQPQAPPIGKIVNVAGDTASGLIESDIQKSVAGVTLLRELNTVLKHDASGVLGMTGENQFYLTLKARSDFNAKYPAIGKVIAGAGVMEKLTKDDPIRSIRIIRVGQAATDFKTDNDSFQKLLQEKAKTLAPVKAPAKPLVKKK